MVEGELRMLYLYENSDPNPGYEYPPRLQFKNEQGDWQDIEHVRMSTKDFKEDPNGI